MQFCIAERIYRFDCERGGELLYRMTVVVGSNRPIEINNRVDRINTTAALALIADTDSVNINHKEQRINVGLGSIMITSNRDYVCFARLYETASVRSRIAN